MVDLIKLSKNPSSIISLWQQHIGFKEEKEELEKKRDSLFCSFSCEDKHRLFEVTASLSMIEKLFKDGSVEYLYYVKYLRNEKIKQIFEEIKSKHEPWFKK